MQIEAVLGNIRAELARRGRTQGSLAGPLGISGAQVSARLSGRVPLNLRDLGVIADELGVSVESLMATSTAVAG